MDQPTKPNPPEPSWSSDYFREPVPAGVSPLGRGLVGHVPLVAIFLLVQGVLEVMVGAIFLMSAMFFLLVNDPQLAGMRALAWLMVGMAAPACFCGCVRVVAGVCNLRYRRRVLGMTALGLGLLTMITGYCALTSIGLAVYGLIVYLNESVAAAFAMGESGKTNADIQAAFPPI